MTGLAVSPANANSRRVSPRPDRTETAWNLAAAAVCCAMAIFLGVYTWYALNVGFDVSLILHAAREGAAGRTLYADPLGNAFTAESRNFYGPPALALAYLPLSVVPDAIAVRLAFVFGYAAALGSLALLVGPVRHAVGRSARASLVVGVMLAYAVLGGANLGNPSILVLVGLAVAYVGIERDRPWLVALGVGTAAALRLYPVLLLVPLAISGRLRAAAALLVVIAAWGVAAIAAFGIDETLTYLSLAASILSPADPNAIVINAALPALAVRVDAPDVVVPVLRVISVVLGVAALAGGGLLLRDSRPERRLLALGIAAGGMLLLPATIWDHYLTALIVLVVGVVAVTRRARWGLLSVGLLPTAVGGGVAMVALPAVAVAAAIRSSRRMAPAGEPALRPGRAAESRGPG